MQSPLMNCLDLHPLRVHQGILDIDTEIANCRLDLGMPKQDLDSAQNYPSACR